MKSIQIYLVALIAGVIAISCSSDDDSTPEILNEEEVITTVRVQLSNSIGIITTLESVDADGDGPNAPQITISGALSSNTQYTGTVLFSNDNETPPENITLEVIEESDEHQVFFTPASSLNVTTTPTNFDDNGNPLGTEFILMTGDVSTGNFTVTLRHEPVKPNTGLASAGGETDVEVTFPLEVE